MLFLYDALSTSSSNVHTIPASSGNIVVDISEGMNLTPSEGAGYAIYDTSSLKNSSGSASAPRAFVLFNYQDHAGAMTSYTLSGGSAFSFKGQADVRMLTAPNILDNAAIAYNGQTVSGEGVFAGKAAPTTITCSGTCVVQVPGPGAALVTLREAAEISKSSNPTSSSGSPNSPGGAGKNNGALTLSVDGRLVLSGVFGVAFALYAGLA